MTQKAQRFQWGDFLRKPLQKRNEQIESMLNEFARMEGHVVVLQTITDQGEFISRNTGDITYLIESANSSLIKPTPDSIPHFGSLLASWMSKWIAKKKLTSEMLRDLRNDLGHIRFYHVLNPAIPTRGEPLPHWKYIAEGEDFSEPKKLAAYAFAHQLTLGGFTNLKQCKLDSCRHFFIGRPNKKWCSESCGSLVRTRKSRKTMNNKFR